MYASASSTSLAADSDISMVGVVAASFWWLLGSEGPGLRCPSVLFDAKCRGRNSGSLESRDVRLTPRAAAR